MSAEAAVTKSNALLSIATNPSSTPQQRRTFFEHLLTLPTYPSYKAKAHFGYLVPKYFAECEDLQDKAVDAILDLCEDDDEKTRIVGIKGLGSTGKTDPRWVGGNVGVLLQLLECPPTELKHVREAIFTLLSVSPSDVLSVMIDDFRGSESETGASRRNILSFLVDQAGDARKTILESGDYPKAEKVFRQGFGDVLGTLSWNEDLKVLGMMCRLSTISGRKATRELSGDFLRMLRKAVKEDAEDAKVEGLIGVFEVYMGRKPPVDARAVLVFLSAHGEVVVRLALGKGDKASKEIILHRLDGWVEESVKTWKGDVKDKEFEEGKVGPDFCDSMLRGLKDQRELIGKTKDANMTVRILEAVLDAIYRIIAIKDRRTDIISRSQKDTFYKITTQVKNLFVDPANEDAKLNIQKICTVLSDPQSKLVDITPSWRVAALPKAVVAVPPTGPRQLVRPPSGPKGEKRVIPPSGPSSERRTSQPIAGPSGSDHFKDRSITNGSAPPRSRSPTKVQQLQEDDRPPTPPTPVESPVKEMPSLPIASSSRVIPPASPSPTKPSERALPAPKRSTPITAVQTPAPWRQPKPTSNAGIELLGPEAALQRTESRAGKELLPGPKTESTQDTNGVAVRQPEVKPVPGLQRVLPPHLQPRSGPSSELRTTAALGATEDNKQSAPQEQQNGPIAASNATPRPPSSVAKPSISPLKPTLPTKNLLSRLGPQASMSSPLASPSTARHTLPAIPIPSSISAIVSKPDSPPRAATPVPLSSRLGPAVNPSETKRPRDTSPVSKTVEQEIRPARSGLLGRLGNSTDERESKRLREVSAGGTGLAGRMARGEQLGSASTSAPQQVKGDPPIQAASSIRGRATPIPALPQKPPSEMTIRKATPQITPEPTTLTPLKLVSFLGHARNAAPTLPAPSPQPSSAGLNIRNSSRPPAPTTQASPIGPIVVEQGITRKGRGFADTELGGDDLMDGSRASVQTGSGGKGSLQERLGGIVWNVNGSGDGLNGMANGSLTNPAGFGVNGNGLVRPRRRGR